MKKILFVLIFSLIISPTLSFAQGGGSGNTGGNTGSGNETNVNVTIPNPTNAGNDIMSILYAILRNVIMPIAAVAVVIWIIWAGFTFLTAQGKPAEIQKAKARLLWSLIGAGILLGAVGISEVVQNTIESLLA